jgi:methylthioribose-1-phosphate isomerase
MSLGLVQGTEGNLSTFDGAHIVATRTGTRLADLAPEDLVEGPLEGDLAGATGDLEVHRAEYRSRGRGAVVHAHPPGSVPEDGGGPGSHGSYVFASTLDGAVEETIRRARDESNTRSGARRVRPVEPPPIRPIEWRDGTLRILDQRRLPSREVHLVARRPSEVAAAIASMAVRGAPLLGITAAYGVALAAERSSARTSAALLKDLRRAGDLLVSSRPTAVNVAWAVRRVLDAAGRFAPEGPASVRRAVLREAHLIAREDEAACRAIGLAGAELVPDRAGVLTHCNTGALATGGWGTAQGIIVAAHRAGKAPHVWVDETRPVLQGARLTAWELQRLGIPMTLQADTAAGSLMAEGGVDVVLVGADRIAANGDVANKIGTYPLAVLARHHGIPFYVAAPLSTVDPSTPTGAGIRVEARPAAEVSSPFGRASAPRGTAVRNPAFDVTPARLVTAIVTDRGTVGPPYGPSLRRLLRAAGGGAA